MRGCLLGGPKAAETSGDVSAGIGQRSEPLLLPVPPWRNPLCVLELLEPPWLLVWLPWLPELPCDDPVPLLEPPWLFDWPPEPLEWLPEPLLDDPVLLLEPPVSPLEPPWFFDVLLESYRSNR